MKNLICIVCPIGCSLEVGEEASPENLSVTGNNCRRGADYALEEIRSPKRTVTATALIEADIKSIRRVPVKTSTPCPREKISALLDDVYKLKVPLPVKTGDVLIKNWNGEGIDIIAARSLCL
ncbi:MAG: DUF1667 domain-containing protein [Treponema sp.]|nr:DUF1667 domain-containing protein [Treponema sp.]MCL2272900.1 DUF1667 domain-containing protein [Treponema sp.]